MGHCFPNIGGRRSSPFRFKSLLLVEVVAGISRGMMIAFSGAACCGLLPDLVGGRVVVVVVVDLVLFT